MTDEPVTVFADDARIEALSSYADRLDELAGIFHDAAAGDGELLDRRPGEGAWSVGEVLHHLADAELHAAVRLRRMLTEDVPAWPEWDEDEHARVLAYDARPAADSLAVLLAVRNENLRMLAVLSPEQWARTGVHPSLGPLDVAGWVALQVDHLAQHVLQARRALLGMV